VFYAATNFYENGRFGDRFLISFTFWLITRKPINSK